MGIYKAKTGVDDDGKAIYGAAFAMTPGRGVDEDVVKSKVESGEWVEEKAAAKRSTRGKAAAPKKDAGGDTPPGDTPPAGGSADSK